MESNALVMSFASMENVNKDASKTPASLDDFVFLVRAVVKTHVNLSLVLQAIRAAVVSVPQLVVKLLAPNKPLVLMVNAS